MAALMEDGLPAGQDSCPCCGSLPVDWTDNPFKPTQPAEAGHLDALDAIADQWIETAGVQRMSNAIASVFENHGPQDIMDRFREKITALIHLAFVEGAAHRLAYSEPRLVAGFTWPEPKVVPVKHGQQLNPDRVKAAFELLNGEMVIGEQLQLIEMLLDGTDITLVTHSPALTEAGPWVPRIGDPVKVSPDATYAADWARTDLWVAGVAVDDRGRGVNVTVSEQWPVPMRHSRGYLGLTDDFIVARTDGKPDDLMPSTQGGAEG